MKPRFAIIALAIFGTGMVSALADAPVWTGNSSVTYSIRDLDNFDPRSYPYTRWGNQMDSANFSGSNTLFFSNLTLMHENDNLDQDSWDLFLSSSNSSLNRVMFPGTSTWDWGNGQVSFSDSGNRILFRYLHFLPVPEEPAGAQLPAGASKIIFIIHGWNPDGNADPFASAHFSSLYTNLTNATAGTDWTVFRYDWASDADTGDTLFPVTDPSEASEHGHQHGQHLGDLLFQRNQDLTNVHLIAHSAGGWVARGAARNLLNLNPNIHVEVTLLDPFMPSAVFLNDSSLGKSIISNLDEDLSGTQLYLLENFYADEIAIGTQETFSWRAGVDLNHRLDGSGKPAKYDEHSGPVQWYADTILSASGTTVADLVSYDLATYGGRRSMFFNEPIVVLEPADSIASIGSTAAVSAQISTRDLQSFPGDSQSPAIAYQWYKWNGSEWLLVSGQTNADLQLPNAQADDSGNYLLRASNSAGQVATQSIDLSVVTTAYNTWISGYPGLPVEELNTDDDFDGDNHSNFFEYAHNLSPLVANTAPVFENLQEDGLLKLIYERFRSDVTYIVEVSADLETWTTVGVDQGSTEMGPVVASVPIPPGGAVRFLRLSIE